MTHDPEINGDAGDEHPLLDDAYPGATDATQAAEPAPSVLAGLDLDLTVRCGHINLSLSALQHLAPGSVLGISGVTPGHAGARDLVPRRTGSRPRRVGGGGRPSGSAHHPRGV